MSMAFLKEAESVGIIGTAGRGSDARKLSKWMYDKMYTTVSDIIGRRYVDLVSGGAAWADHLAVKQFLFSAMNPGLTLELPTFFRNGQYDEVNIYNGFNVGSISNHYHRKFSTVVGCDSLREIQLAIDNGARVEIGKGFFDRNLKIAKADIMIAFTFGDKEKLKDGGTAHTAKAYLENGGQKLYHVNLNDFTVYELNKWPG
jgi:hypothetical protein